MKTKQDEIEAIVKAVIRRNRMIEQALSSNDGDHKLPWWVEIPAISWWLSMLFIWTLIAINIFNLIFK
jgi:hypothetical protein